MASRKEVKELLAELRRQGWRVEEGAKKYKAYAPDGKGIVRISKTPSARNWRKRAVSELRRHGFKWNR